MVTEKEDAYMKFKSCFEVVDVADEYLAIPVGEIAKSYGGVVALSETAAFLLKQMITPKTKEELTDLLVRNYEINLESAKKQIDTALILFDQLGLIEK